MRIETRFGTFDIEEDMIITFPQGILGLKGQKRYILLDHSETQVLKWLQSVDAPEIALPVISPTPFFPKYRPKVSREDLGPIKLESPEDAVVLNIITVPQDPKKATANLRAPIVVNPHKRLADQIILQDQDYALREPLNLDKIAYHGRCESC